MRPRGPAALATELILERRDFGILPEALEADVVALYIDALSAERVDSLREQLRVANLRCEVLAARAANDRERADRREGVERRVVRIQFMPGGHRATQRRVLLVRRVFTRRAAWYGVPAVGDRRGATDRRIWT